MGRKLQERGRAGRAEHVAEVARRAHQHVLHRVGEDPPALGDTVGEDVEVLLQQDDVGGVLGHVGGRVDRDAHVGGVQRERVVDAVAEERARRRRSLRCARTMRAFCSGLTRANTVVSRPRRRSEVVVEPRRVGPGQGARACRPRSPADLRSATFGVVAGDAP